MRWRERGQDYCAVGKESQVDTVDFGHEAIRCEDVELSINRKCKVQRYVLQPAVGKDVMYKVSLRRLSRYRDRRRL